MQTTIIVSSNSKKETEQFAPFSAFFGSFFVFSAQQFWTAVGLSDLLTMTQNTFAQ